MKSSTKEEKEGGEFAFLYQKKSLLIITLIIFCILIVQFAIYHIPVIIDLHLPCINYLKEGVLYEGQPQCMHGPIFYALIAPFRLLFGENYFFIITLFNAIVYTITFFIILKIMEKEKTKISIGVISFLFIFLIVLPFVDNLGELYSMPLLLTAYYLLFHSDWKYKSLVTGVIFALLIHMKMNNIVFIALLSFFYLLRERKKCQIKETIKEIIAIILVIASITSLIVILFPNTLEFTLISNLEGEKESLGTTIKLAVLFLIDPYVGNEALEEINIASLFKKTAFIDPQVIFLYIFVPLIFIIWWKRKRDPITALLFLGFWSIFLLSFRNFDQFTFRYMFPILPFLLMGVLKLEDGIKWRGAWKIGILIMIFTVMQFTNSYGWYGWNQEIQDREFLELRKLVEKPYSFLPVNQSILTDNRRILEINGYEVNKSLITEFPRKLSLQEKAIHPYVYNLDKIGVLSEKWKTRGDLGVENVNEVGEKILENKYDIIIYTPKSHIETLLALIIQKLRHEKGPNAKLEDIGYKCNVENIPSLEFQCFGCKYTRSALFKDEEVCKEFMAKGWEYYKKMFDEICDKDEFIANEIINIGEEKSCDSGRDVIIRKTGKGIFNSWNDVLMLIGIFVLGSWILYKRK